MAVIAAFGRTFAGAGSIDQDGSVFDPFNYQMVPVGGQRTWGVRVSGGEVGVASLNTAVASITRANTPPNSAVVDNTQPFIFFGTTPTIHEFHILGKMAGRTEIVAFDVNFTVLARITVSVKQIKTLTYNLFQLLDIGRSKPARSRSSLEQIARNVEGFYFNQTNTRMIRRRSEVLLVKDDLGDPISTDFPFIRALSKSAPEKIRDRIKELNLNDADRHLVSTWNIDDDLTRGFTLNFGHMIMVEAQPDEILETIHFAHELGHSFKLRHELHGTPEFLMHTNSAGFKMTEEDIDRINPSGT